MGIRRSVSGVLVAALSAGFIALTAGQAAALTSEESGFVSKINAERRERDKQTLTVKSQLVEVARRHSARMASKGKIWHNDNLPNEVDCWTVVGENVGMGPSVESLHKAFMNSPGHRANILRSEYNQIGVGVVIRDDVIYVTEVFAKCQSAPKTSSVKGNTVRRTSSPAPAPAAKPAPAPKPKPKPKPVVADPQSVDLLVDLIGLDAEEVDPATGIALGL